MSYKAIICRLSNVRPHPNANKLMLANALGYSVIVGLDAKEGDLGIVFPSDGRLSHEMCMANNLYRKHPETGEAMGGYFDDKGRVKTLKLRGANSEAFFTGLESLDWVEGSKKFVEGQEIDKIGKQVICEKYYTRATLSAMAKEARKYKKPWYIPKFLAKYHKKYIVGRVAFDPCPTFKKHFDTSKLRQWLSMVPEGKDAYFSSKMHGTSGRTGRVLYRKNDLMSRFLGLFGLNKGKYEYVSGTRNVTKSLKWANRKDDGYYAGTDFRQKIHKQIEEVGLKKGEVIYYEIVGYQSGDTPIMPTHSLSKSMLKDSGFTKEQIAETLEAYGETVSYTYGCKPEEFDVYVYRITQDGVDLPNNAMRLRCHELKLKPVNQLGRYSTDEDLMAIAERLSRQQDGDGQLREGVAIRIQDPETGELIKILKYKSFLFCLLEGIKKNSDDYVDLEEIS